MFQKSSSNTPILHSLCFQYEIMSSPHYSLRWNNHQSHLLNAFDSLLQNETLVDVTLVCEKSSYKAHKVVLSACR